MTKKKRTKFIGYTATEISEKHDTPTDTVERLRVELGLRFTMNE